MIKFLFILFFIFILFIFGITIVLKRVKRFMNNIFSINQAQDFNQSNHHQSSNHPNTKTVNYYSQNDEVVYHKGDITVMKGNTKKD